MANDNTYTYCPQCGEALLPGAKFCVKCGTKTPSTGNQTAPGPQALSDQTSAASKANPATTVNQAASPYPTPVQSDNNQLAVEAQQQQMPLGNAKNKWIAVLLCFFLGFMGAHKFYEGKIGKGFLYLLISLYAWYFSRTVALVGFGLIWISDLFVLLFLKPNPYEP